MEPGDRSSEESDNGGQASPAAVISRQRPPDGALLTHEAVALFAVAEVPRSLRSIERYCKNGKLEAYLAPDEDKYYITRASVDE